MIKKIIAGTSLFIALASSLYAQNAQVSEKGVSILTSPIQSKQVT